MANFNLVVLAGNLTRDPELSFTPNNAAVCKFGIAVNRKWTDRNSGEACEETGFFDITAFGKSGETINKYMKKGSQILVQGRLNYSKWTTKDGQKRSKVDVVADAFQFLGSKPQGGQSQQQDQGDLPF